MCIHKSVQEPIISQRNQSETIVTFWGLSFICAGASIYRHTLNSDACRALSGLQFLNHDSHGHLRNCLKSYILWGKISFWLVLRLRFLAAYQHVLAKMSISRRRNAHCWKILWTLLAPGGTSPGLKKYITRSCRRLLRYCCHFLWANPFEIFQAAGPVRFPAVQPGKAILQVVLIVCKFYWFWRPRKAKRQKWWKGCSKLNLYCEKWFRWWEG